MPTIDIVFDGPPGPESGRFVEVESPPGKGISFGQWVQRGDGFWALRFDPPNPKERGETTVSESSEQKAMIPGDDIPWDLLKQTVNIHAKAGLIPRETTFEQAMVCAALGHQLGIPRFEAMRGIVVVDGKPTLMAGLLQAVVMRSLPDLEVVLVKYARDECVVKGRRSPSQEWTEVSWDWEDAELAGLTRKKNWQKYPKAMLYARASTVLLRMLGAHVVHGLYTPDEMGAVESPDDGAFSATVEDPDFQVKPADHPVGPGPEEAVEVPFTPTPGEQEHLDQVDELASRIEVATETGGASAPESTDGASSSQAPEAQPSPSEPESREPAKKETRAGRLRRLSRIMVEAGHAKLQKEIRPYLERALGQAPGADDDKLVRITLQKRADEKAAKARKSEATHVPADTLEVEDRFAKMGDDDLMDECSRLEDLFTEGRSEDALAQALDYRKRAQDNSPNWSTTEKREELLVYARNLDLEYAKLIGSA